MSFFMTVSGDVIALNQCEAELIPANLAQACIAKLEARLESLDGSPVFLVHDGDSGTSDGLVADLKSALWEEVDPSSTQLFSILSTCFEAGITFRIWLANNDSNALVATSEQVSTLASTIEALRLRCGAWWHAR